MVCVALWFLSSFASYATDSHGRGQNIVVLGVGRSHGDLHKSEVFERIHRGSRCIYAFDCEGNPPAPGLKASGLIQAFFSLKKERATEAYAQNIGNILKSNNIKPDAIFTPREEWLQPAAQLSKNRGSPSGSFCPHPFSG